MFSANVFTAFHFTSVLERLWGMEPQQWHMGMTWKEMGPGHGRVA